MIVHLLTLYNTYFKLKPDAACSTNISENLGHFLGCQAVTQFLILAPSVIEFDTPALQAISRYFIKYFESLKWLNTAVMDLVFGSKHGYETSLKISHNFQIFSVWESEFGKAEQMISEKGEMCECTSWWSIYLLLIQNVEFHFAQSAPDCITTPLYFQTLLISYSVIYYIISRVICCCGPTCEISLLSEALT